MTAASPIRVLVVDDSASVRRALADVLAGEPDIALAGEAADGQEALSLALALSPDIILLDLEMPRMDGFAFLRLLRAQRSAIPVLVISRHRGSRDVHSALDLGAQDFVQKPSAGAGAASPEVRALLDRIRRLVAESRGTPAPKPFPGPPGPFRVALLGASTGGPAAIQCVLEALPEGLPLCLLVAQHMPERFTPAFAERLDRASAFAVSEARQGDELAAGRCLVAPGGKSIAVAEGEHGLVVNLVAKGRGLAKGRRYVPSVDLLFSTAAKLLGERAMGVVLTGMGDDGCEGLRAIGRAGGRTVAEAQESAVVFGMPQAAIESGVVTEVLPLPDIVRAIVAFGRGG